jgi:Ca-activated chloride channel homolog
VAELTGGTFFEAADQDALEAVYAEIGSQVGVEHEQRELTVLFTAAGAALLLMGGVLSALWFARIP